MAAINEAYYQAVAAVASRYKECPLPKGLCKVVTPDWEVTLNTTSEPQMVEDIAALPPFEVLAQHRRFLIIASLSPFEGCIGGGMSEGEFITEMQAIGEHADGHV